MNAIDAYARAVVAGKLPAGKYHRLACVRHESDRDRARSPGFPYYFDDRKAIRFFEFAHRLRHYKGEWAGQQIHLEPYQQFRLGSVFGWRHVETHLRRFRTAYNEIPRKQGKSLEAAIVALYVTFFDHEPGAEGYCVATKRDQAKIVFNDCKKLVRSSGLRHRVTEFVANLHRDDTASKLEPLGADGDSTDGLNPHLIIVDEYHALKDRALIDVMETATGSRRQPLNFQITTAGNDPQSPCGDQHDYACKILDGILVDDTFFAFIAHAEPDDDPFAETTWRKANPNYGVSVRPDDLRALATKARHMPGAAAAFKQKRLNLWVNTNAPWLSMEGWRAGQTSWTAEDMIGQMCWVGVDMSSKIDLTAVVFVFPPTDDRRAWRLLAHCFTPEDTLLDRAHRDRAPYAQWVAGGYLHTNPGNRIDQDGVRDLLLEMGKRFAIQSVGIDPYNAGNLVQHLQNDGHHVIEIPQTIPQITQPAKDFEADVLDGLVDAGGNPLMLWCASNAVVQRDGKDNIFPTKRKSRGRIDPIVAAIMARKLATTPVAPERPFQMFVLGAPHV